MHSSEPPPSGPQRDRVRQLTLRDLILLVAVFAVWSVLVRSWIKSMQLSDPWYRWVWFLGVRNLVGGPLAYLLILASLTLMGLRLGRPRPAWRRVWRQPGLVATAGAVVGLAIGLLGTIAEDAVALQSRQHTFLDCCNQVKPYAAPAVLGGWLALGLTGRWRSERSGVDRLGRLVGWLWLVEFALGELPMSKWSSIITNIWGGNRP